MTHNEVVELLINHTECLENEKRFKAMESMSNAIRHYLKPDEI